MDVGIEEGTTLVEDKLKNPCLDYVRYDFCFYFYFSHYLDILFFALRMQFLKRKLKLSPLLLMLKPLSSEVLSTIIFFTMTRTNF